jgi:prepilin-type N-terminal cleavage/methylation domain-containing protein
MITRPNTRRAFTMTEILMALSLLTIFFTIAGQLFKSCVTLSSDGPNLSNHACQIDSALFQLRRDLWNSPQISVPNSSSADLDSSEGKISWTINPSGDLIRTDSHNRSEQWKSIAQHWSLASGGSCLTIADGHSQMRLPSQILLAQGANP